jgi:predicted DNA-binding transcriptional regulator AlpA
VDADSIDAAREIATTGVLEQAAACGLPTRPVTRIEVVREDIRDAELKRPTLPELVSGPEAAEILGVSRQRVHQLAHQHPDFPAPTYRLGVGSLWFRAAVERFTRDWERKPGRPATQSA